MTKFRINNMNTKDRLPATLLLFIIFLISCTTKNKDQGDMINDPNLTAQAEVREAIISIVKDAEMANIDGLQAAHLHSNKFTKFGPRQFERQDVESTNKSEAAFFGSISEYKQEIKELKIDVFGNTAVATYYPHVTFKQNGEEKKVSGRQTFVFLKTENSWKLVHEHGTPRF